MKKVIINTEFIDRHTKKKYKPGKTVKMTEERVAEIKEVNPHLITVIGNAEERDAEKGSGENKNPDENKSSDENENPE